MSPNEGDAQIRLALSTAPDEDTARRLAKGMVESRLAACVSVVPGIHSTYHWNGEVATASEVLLLIKCSQDREADLESWLVEHHPYEVPELIILPIEGGHLPYLKWVAERPGGRGGA